VIVFAYRTHKASSLDQLLVVGLLYTNTLVCTSFFILQTQESFISYTFTSAAIFQGFHHKPSFPSEHLMMQALFTHSQSDGRTVCSSTGAKGGSPVLSASVAPDHLLVWMFLPCLIPAVIQYQHRPMDPHSRSDDNIKLHRSSTEL